MSPIEGKVALVTGGASGIGFAIVREFLQSKAKGIGIVDIAEETGNASLKKLSDEFGGERLIFVQADVSDKNQFEAAFNKIIEKFKQLDIVVNNAGILDETRREQTLALNLGGTIHGSYLALEYLPKHRKGEEGIIFNVASGLGLRPGQCCPVYSSTKSGIISLGRALGGEGHYKQFKVRVLTICPGAVDTNMKHALQEGKFLLPEAAKEELDEINPLRIAPEIISRAAVKIIDEGTSGSVWVMEDDKPLYRVEIPDLRQFKV